MNRHGYKPQRDGLAVVKNQQAGNLITSVMY